MGTATRDSSPLGDLDRRTEALFDRCARAPSTGALRDLYASLVASSSLHLGMARATGGRRSLDHAFYGMADAACARAIGAVYEQQRAADLELFGPIFRELLSGTRSEPVAQARSDRIPEATRQAQPTAPYGWVADVVKRGYARIETALAGMRRGEVLDEARRPLYIGTRRGAQDYADRLVRGEFSLPPEEMRCDERVRPSSAIGRALYRAADALGFSPGYPCAIRDQNGTMLYRGSKPGAERYLSRLQASPLSARP